MYDDNFDPENTPELEALFALLDQMPKNVVLLLNLPRFKEVQLAITKIVKIACADDPDAEVKMEFDSLTGTTLLLEITADVVSIRKTKDFAQALTVTNTMSAEALRDGRVRLGFTFHDVRLPAPPVK